MLEILTLSAIALQNTSFDDEIILPKPQRVGKVSVEEAICKRRTIRVYSDKAINLNELSQLLWAAQGVTSKEGLRAAPSAGALYPLEIYVVVGNIEKLDKGIYKYNPFQHSIKKIKIGDYRKVLTDFALGQEQVQTAAANIIICAVYKRISWKYGERCKRYVDMEVGHSAQNLLLQAEALGIGCCPVGAFYDEKVKKILNTEIEEPLYIITIGKK